MTGTTLPDPLVPAEVDLTDFQYMELDVQKLRDSRFAAEVEPEAFRAGVLLWCASWHQVPASSLPNNDVELSNLAGFGRVVKEWKKVREQALALFVLCSDGRLYHRIVAEKALQAWGSKLQHHYDRARDRLRKLNKQRESQKLPPLPESSFEAWNAQRVAARIPMEKAEAAAGIPPKAPPPSKGIPPENALRGNGEGTERRGNGEGDSLVDAATPAAPPPPAPPAPPDPAAKAAATPRGERLAKDWQLPKSWGDWALAKYPQWTTDKVRDEALKFRNHWCAKTGKDATKVEWDSTWQNWCMSDIAHRDDPKPNGRTPPVDLKAKNADAKRILFGPGRNAEGTALEPGPRQEILDA